MSHSATYGKSLFEGGHYYYLSFVLGEASKRKQKFYYYRLGALKHAVS